MTHRFTLLLFLMLSFIGGCSSSEDSNGATPTPTPFSNSPVVISSVPEDGAIDVVRNSEISARFDRDMDATTLDSPATGFSVETGSVAVAGTVTYDAADQTVTFVPDSDLPPSADVTVRVAISVKDAEGNPVASEISWQLTTGTTSDATAPTFAGITGASDNGDGTATLSWIAATDDFTPTNSIVYRAYLSSALNSLVESAKGTTSMTTSAFAAGTYSFTVRARDSAGNEDGNTASTTVTITIPHSWSTDVYPLFSVTCTDINCHDSNSPQKGLNLSTVSAAYSGLVSVFSTEVPSIKRVLPGDPDQSYLYQKLTGVASFGSQMPLLPALPLSSAELATIRSWILGGALND